MEIVRAGFQILSSISEGGIRELQMIERAARVCYKSEGKMTENGDSAKKLIGGLIKRGHEAMLEHSSLSILFIVDRGISHELVRHRLFSFAQESTRYCNYSRGGFGNGLTFIYPLWLAGATDSEWHDACCIAEDAYISMISNGASPEQARSVLPNSLKTEIVVTGNYRQWRKFFELRAVGLTGKPHPQMLEVTEPLLHEVARRIPVVFDDVLDKMLHG